METRTLTKTELSRYIDRSILIGKQAAADSIASYMEGRALELFREGNDAAAVEMRDMGKTVRVLIEEFAAKEEELVKQGKSDERRGDLQGVAAELDAGLEVLDGIV